MTTKQLIIELEKHLEVHFKENTDYTKDDSIYWLCAGLDAQGVAYVYTESPDGGLRYFNVNTKQFKDFMPPGV
jgi:hypothetical protein